jgi:hypothetical protein
VSGAGLVAASACSEARGVSPALFNPLLALVALASQLSGAPTGSCQGVHIIAPLLGVAVGALLSFLTGLTGVE